MSSQLELFDALEYDAYRFGPYCLDCGVDTIEIGQYPYAVVDEVWHEAVPASTVPAGTGMLCIPCLEKRIGRPLKREDFETITWERGWLPRDVRERMWSAS
jgi:hypothetical protein